MSHANELKSRLGQLENDGSRQLAESHILALDEAKMMGELLTNKTFAAILDRMKVDMRKRLLDLIAQDPDLAAMKRMFERTIGVAASESKIEEVIKTIVENIDEE